MCATLVLVAGNCKLDEFVISGRDQPDGPVAGTLLVVLTTPNADDGAVRFTLTGPQVTTPRQASSSYLVFSSQRAPGELDIAVFGDVQSEALVAMPILDVATAENYGVTITAVATRGDTLRTDLSGYSVLVQVVPDQDLGN
jgi:hypothetical protein